MNGARNVYGTTPPPTDPVLKSALADTAPPPPPVDPSGVTTPGVLPAARFASASAAAGLLFYPQWLKVSE